MVILIPAVTSLEREPPVGLQSRHQIPRAVVARPATR